MCLLRSHSYHDEYIYIYRPCIYTSDVPYTLWLHLHVCVQGFLVVSMEHTDGSGSAVRVPYIAADGKSIRTRWLFYQGISKDTHSMKIAHRVQELQSCRDVLEALDSGESL